MTIIIKDSRVNMDSLRQLEYAYATRGIKVVFQIVITR